jgi:carboxypeptidase Q
VVLWTNEENGLGGGRQYAQAHESELPNHVAAIEADTGCFAPQGFSLDHADATQRAIGVAQLTEILKLLAPIEATRAWSGFAGADLIPMGSHGVPRLGLRMDRSTYFRYHHTHADTVEKINPAHLTKNVAAMAVLAYVLADMPGRLGNWAE